MGVTEQLAKFAVDPPAGFMQPSLVESIEERFLDTIGVMVAGARSPGSCIVRKTVLEAGGAPQATIVGTGEKTSLVNAGFVNGVSAHALEYDDITPEVSHISSSMVPACLAVAEQMDLSGRQMLEAFALGFEVTGRICIGFKPMAMLDRGFHSPGMMGGLGAAVAAGRLMQLDAMGMRMAIGLMASSGVGIRKNVGSAGKAFHIGQGVRSGLQAACLARNGFAVDPDVIEPGDQGHGHQRFGLAESYVGSGNYSLERMVEGLGSEFLLTRIPNMVRMHPCSTVNCVGIDAMIELATRNDLKAADIAQVEVAAHPRMLMISPYTEPSDSYRAKFTSAYTFAAALVDRKVGIAQFSEARIHDPEILGLMRRIKINIRQDIKEDRGWCGHEDSWTAVKIAIHLHNGKTLGGSYVNAKGWPGNPARWNDLCGKYEECADGIMTAQQIRESIAMIRQLHELPSVRDLVALLAKPA